MMPSYDPQDDVMVLDGLPPSTMNCGWYKITITLDDVRGMKWVGNLHRCGTELLEILNEMFAEDLHELLTQYDIKEVEAHVTQAAAWQIKDIVDEDQNLSCLSDSFALKLHGFCSTIV